jgi:syntaxin 18
MQEERFKRQLERTRSLGSVAPREALEKSLGKPEDDKRSWLQGASSTLASSFAARIGTSSSRESSQIASKPADSGQVSDDEDDEIELSQSQIFQFETENANILRSAQDTLESVQLAESRLLEISALQMELVTHLTRQTELTEQLYEDAIATTLTVDKGNVQLREAKRRAKDSRIFILVFLIGASLSLLFLHYY